MASAHQRHYLLPATFALSQLCRRQCGHHGGYGLGVDLQRGGVGGQRSATNGTILVTHLAPPILDQTLTAKHLRGHTTIPAQSCEFDAITYEDNDN
jgi:hypothetical protein